MNDVLSMMEDVDSMHVVKTPCVSINSISHDSADSGYLSIVTPQTSGCTPKIAGYRTRSSTGALFSAKKHRYRPDPFLCEKVLRHRTKFNYRLNISEFHNTPDYLVSKNPVEQDSILESSCTHDNQSLSLVHSTPSCANNEFDRPLRNRRNWRTTVPVTPASTDFQIFSPPPSPAVPSSSDIASEPILEDAEMKLVCTPHGKSQQVRTPPKLKVLIPRVMISPIHTRNSPIITSADNRKLCELRITDLAASSEIKPKKLDFSHRGLCASLRNSRRLTFDYTGREKVDFLSLLGEESNHLNLVSKILSFLTPQDLCSASVVSRVWRKICKSDSCANKRKMSFIMRKNTIKENLWLLAMAKKAKCEEDIQTSPKSRRYVRKGYLLDVQNLLQVPAQPNSPPVSPSKIKFHSFVKASRTLASGEYLLPCPRCSFPCHVDSEKNVGACSRQGCSIEFCISCSSKPHAGPCKTPLLATPTKRNNKRLIAGSRQSKRNLRRL
ncbi:PREDICTED: F-box only protein 43-like [Trachymyrmex cornetzi]|uniref:F-box only protein 43 n=1 Tax=Trachymyrmex cornetzi TaxID=471704 RepID=A0A151J0I6_9HYME|nr:PREDICTED: F-box only protein 43-like [Trachymyrmex cornetzi]KYN14780.1 F-box only protein 43 [Trachymyrmex cornetzi]